jgi:hypothetical protein
VGCKNVCCAAYVGHGTKLLEQAASATAYLALGWTHSPKEAAASTIAQPTGAQCFWFSPTMDPMNSSKRSSLLRLHDQASLRIRPSRIGLTLFRASRF